MRIDGAEAEQTRYVFVCRQSCFVRSYCERRRQLDSSVYVKEKIGCYVI